MSNVTPLPGVVLPAHSAAPEIVECLERALARAKDGDAIGLGLVEVTRDGAYIRSFHHEAGARHTLLAGVAALTHRLFAGEM